METSLGFESLPTAQGANMDEELKETLKSLFDQAEFHADEYRDELLFSFEQRKLTPGIIARFEGIANEIKALLNDKKPE